MTGASRSFATRAAVGCSRDTHLPGGNPVRLTRRGVGGASPDHHLPTPDSLLARSRQSEAREALMTVADLSPDEREEYEERAAIIEYEGKLPRAEAERAALVVVLRARRMRQIMAEDQG